MYVHVYIHARVFVHASFAELLSEMDMRAPYVFLSVHVCRRASGSWPVRRWIRVGRNATGVAAMRFQRVVHRKERERERGEIVCACVYAAVMVPDATTMVVVISTTMGGEERG